MDDGRSIDAADAGCEGQITAHVAFEACGGSLSPEKKEWMSPSGDFLGVVRDLSKRHASGVVECEPRPDLVRKLRGMTAEFRDIEKCTPSQAPKFRGVQGFMGTAMYGQVSKASIRPFKDRQYLHSETY